MSETIFPFFKRVYHQGCTDSEICQIPDRKMCYPDNSAAPDSAGFGRIFQGIGRIVFQKVVISSVFPSFYFDFSSFLAIFCYPAPAAVLPPDSEKSLLSGHYRISVQP